MQSDLATIKNKKMDKGEIGLKRKDRDFKAGFCVLQFSSERLNQFFHLLHPNEQEFYKKLKYEQRKLSYVLGRTVAKKAIKVIAEEINLSDITIDFGVFQFPVVKGLRDHNIQVSISHCGPLVMGMAFPEEHPLGIDIEKISEDRLEPIKTQLNKKDLEVIKESTLSDLVGCTIMWTIKEGLSKILRTGLTMDFQIIEIASLEKEGNFYCSTFRNFMQYKAISYHLGDYIFTIVLPRRTEVFLEELEKVLMKIENNNI